MPRLLIEHRRSTRQQGITQLWLSVVMFLVFGVVLYAFGPSFWRMDPKFMFLWGVGITVLWVGTVLIPSIIGIVRNREFVCRLTEATLECRCPGWGNGETFEVGVADIVKIQYKGPRDDNSGRELVDRAGNIYWLTKNFGNPVRTIVSTLCELNSAIEID